MRHLITSGLPYINGIKHLGNLVGSMLPADVYARFLRQRGHEVLYICGTDEHGAPAEIAAAEAGVEVGPFCEAQFELQKGIYERFSLDFDHFGRSSRRPNHELTQQIFEELDTNGHIARQTIEQIYSIDEGRFLADRYIEGTCPHCKHPDARGDQCEHCTRLLDPTELIEPRSALSGSTNLEVRSAEHLFLRLPNLQEPVRAWVESKDNWPVLSRAIARKWLDTGLRDRCITRELDWGIPVPRAGLEQLVFYVWFDAPIGYIAATREWAEARDEPDAWKSWWLDAQDVHYTQFIGKDNLPFHTVMFPSMLLGGSSPWKLADQIKGSHWMNYYGGKFSTSRKKGVFTDAAIELYPADYWRYALMAQYPETADATFTWAAFAQTVNKDLAGVFGNFVNRVLKFAERKLGPTVPTGGQPGPAEAKLQAECAEALESWENAMAALSLREAMRALRKLWTLSNLYIDARAPWSVLKTDPDEAAMIVRTCMNLARLNATTALPVIPNLAGRVLRAFGDDPASIGVPADLLSLDGLVPGQPFESIPPLVDKIAPETTAELEERFGN
jgi:methionyl-tRNA synthetase